MTFATVDYIKSKFATESRRRLLDNFFSLSLLQFTSYLLPMITVPYLTRIIGVEKFGLLAFALAFVGYFGIFTDYGFNFSATRAVSIHRDNKEKLSEIFSSVIAIKLGMLSLSFLLLVLLILSFNRFYCDWAVYAVSFFIVVGNTMFPAWFFQGIEQMRYITILNVSAKLFFTILVFVFVRSREDFLYVPILNAIGGGIGACIAFRMVIKKFGMRFYIPSREQIVFYLKDGWSMFASMLFISLYTSSNTFILGILANNTVVGYFAAADKLVGAIKGFTAPISQTVYPYFSKLFSENAARARELLKKMLLVVGILTLAISVCVSFFAPVLVRLLFGPDFAPAVVVVRIMVFVVFAIGLSNVMGVQGLLAFNYKKDFTVVVVVCALLHLLVFSGLVLKMGLIGAPIAVLFTEILISLTFYPILLKRKIL